MREFSTGWHCAPLNQRMQISVQTQSIPIATATVMVLLLLIKGNHLHIAVFLQKGSDQFGLVEYQQMTQAGHGIHLVVM